MGFRVRFFLFLSLSLSPLGSFYSANGWGFVGAKCYKCFDNLLSDVVGRWSGSVYGEGRRGASQVRVQAPWQQRHKKFRVNCRIKPISTVLYIFI